MGEVRSQNLTDCRASDCKFAGWMPVLGITSLCPWDRQLTLISLKALCVVWKDSTRVCFKTAFTGEKIKKPNKKKSGHGTAGISESGSGQLLYA